MYKSLSLETGSHSAGQEITHLLWKPKFHDGVHKWPTL